MLYFLRQLRRLELRKRSGRYFLYAIGEVVLIVIGILIAVQINNWNEGRQTKALQIEILESMRSELQVDIRDIELNIRIHISIVASIERILALLESNQPYENAISDHLINATEGTVFVNSTSAFQTLKSHGIELVESETLRGQIVKLYDGQYGFLHNEQERLSDLLSHGRKEVFNTRFEGTGARRLGPTLDTVEGEMVPLDWEALKEDTEFKYFLRTYRNRNELYLSLIYLPLQKQANALVSSIQTEIEMLENN